MFDHIIIGAGAAGLQLAMSITNDPELKEQSVLILDPESKSVNDKTWCFWEQGEGLYDTIMYKSWSNGAIWTKKERVDLDLNGYKYKMIRSIDFYDYCKRWLGENEYVTWVAGKVTSVSKNNVVSVGEQDYQGRYVFDSRVSREFDNDERSTKLKQHFLGWTIRSHSPVFDASLFTMMDFRSNQNSSCSFTYILPSDKNNALIEFTLFSKDELEQSTYEDYLKNYISEVLGVDSYMITETETGVIPMTDFRFDQDNRDNYLRIGTGGGWVKPSTGYSFRNSQRSIEQVLSNIKAQKPLSTQVYKRQHRFLDSVFLDVLARKNFLGEKIFGSMYQKLPTGLIFKFLDEQTSTLENLRVITGFPDWALMRSFAWSMLRKVIGARQTN